MRVALYIIGFASVIYALLALAWWDPFFPTLDGTKTLLRIVAGSAVFALLLCAPIIGYELTRTRRNG
jgi:CHASE2 domain-containing sensor protein